MACFQVFLIEIVLIELIECNRNVHAGCQSAVCLTCSLNVNINIINISCHTHSVYCCEKGNEKQLFTSSSHFFLMNTSMNLTLNVYNISSIIMCR